MFLDFKIVCMRNALWSCFFLRSFNTSSGAGDGGASAPQKFCFVGNPGKIPKHLGRIHENPKKIPKYLGKIPENRGKNGPQRCLISKNSTQHLQKNIRSPFFGGHTKRRSAKVASQLFGQVWENLGKNPLHTQKFTYSYTYEYQKNSYF